MFASQELQLNNKSVEMENIESKMDDSNPPVHLESGVIQNVEINALKKILMISILK